jgi:2-polyprenyl-3-methyl-5-hydroxy-6-metoxy-1,4-benzoquinol methylase
MADREYPVCLCGARDYAVAATFDSPPAGEVRFDFGGGRYHRELVRCRACGHVRSVHDIDMARLYDGAYVDSTYGEDGIRRTFEKILALDPSKSDNVGRVARVSAFGAARFAGRARTPSVLDVGSGLCVFLHRLKNVAGWDCTALDPDPRAARHAERVAGVTAVCADFMRDKLDGTYDAITFNKVLEHVLDPVAMLAAAKPLLERDGFVYIELPDADAAGRDSYSREEFFIDHHHAFTLESMRLLGEQAGFATLEAEALREPSGKYTLRAFLAPR